MCFIQTIFCCVFIFDYFRTIVLIALFSQYLSNVKIPFPGYSKNKGGCYVGRYPFFRLFPVSIVVHNLRLHLRTALRLEGSALLAL